ncbi:MAG: hypothetical protein RL737_1325 [Bacteroidota bacterium]|jgi:hypothetical protein
MSYYDNQNNLNELCYIALKDTIDEVSWLEKYNSLYKRCSVQPEGRPSISLAFHQGEFFEEIDEFVTKYTKLIEPVKQWTDEDYMNLTDSGI